MLAPPKASLDLALAGRGRPGVLAHWLTIVAALVVAMVIVGGITRLTESGLSITEWKPITGAIPPLSQADWQSEFALYQQTTEYQTVNRGMSMGDFQFIYFWEWAHRFLGRFIGVAMAIPLLWFAVRRVIPVGYGWRLVALLALGGLQGAVGWWMVSSGLVGRVDVSHLRLATHLGLALFILGGLTWTAADLRRLAGDHRSSPARLDRWAVAALGALAVQILWGAFVAGMRAGYAFPTWPLMGNELFPGGTVLTANWLANLIDNPIVVQFFHRWWAFVAFGAMIWLGVRARRAGAKRVGPLLHATVTVQLMLGIATLMTGVSLWIAVAHQAVAAILVVVATLSAHAVSVGASRRNAPETVAAG